MNKTEIYGKFIRMKYILQVIKERLGIIADADPVLQF